MKYLFIHTDFNGRLKYGLFGIYKHVEFKIFINATVLLVLLFSALRQQFSIL